MSLDFTTPEQKAAAAKRLETAFLAGAVNAIGSGTFLLLLGLQNVQTFAAGADAANSVGVEVDLTQRKLHTLGRTVGMALRGCGAIDAFTFKRLQNAMVDGMTDAVQMAEAEASPFLDALHATSSQMYAEFVQYQQEYEAARAVQLAMPEKKLAVQL